MKLMKFVLVNSDSLFELESKYGTYCNGKYHNPTKDMFVEIEQKLNHKSFQDIEAIESILYDFGLINSDDFLILDSNEFYNKWNAMEFANENNYLFLAFVDNNNNNL